jgi:hypothetical protein
LHDGFMYAGYFLLKVENGKVGYEFIDIKAPNP